MGDVMQVNVSGSFDLGQSFIEYAIDKCEKEIGKFSITFDIVDVRVKKNGQSFETHITGAKIISKFESSDVYSSFDESLKKFLTQLRKEKDKVVKNKKTTKK